MLLHSLPEAELLPLHSQNHLVTCTNANRKHFHLLILPFHFGYSTLIIEISHFYYFYSVFVFYLPLYTHVKMRRGKLAILKACVGLFLLGIIMMFVSYTGFVSFVF